MTAGGEECHSEHSEESRVLLMFCRFFILDPSVAALSQDDEAEKYDFQDNSRSG